MSNKAAIIRECEKANAVRWVSCGKVDHSTFFESVTGDMLVSGNEACNSELLADMIEKFSERRDMSTILLTSHLKLLDILVDRQERRIIRDIMVSNPDNKNYQPMYGMTGQQICRLVKAVGEELGYSMLSDKISIYTMAVLDVVSQRYPLSFPAIYQLLMNNDDFIASLSAEEGLPDVIRDNILGNREAGISVRRIMEYLKETFESVSEVTSETKYNFQSGAKGCLSVMAFYQPSYNQAIMNLYLKEEIHGVMQRVPGIRIILDETIFLDENDVLLNYLIDLKRQKRVELIACSQNVLEMLYRKTHDFANVCIFSHSSTTATEELSEGVFGKYLYHYPVLSVGKPPTVFFTLRKDEHWSIATEERLRVRPVDLYSKQSIWGMTPEKMAVYTGNGMVYLVSTTDFLIQKNKRKESDKIEKNRKSLWKR